MKKDENTPNLIIQTDKYGTYHYDVSTPEKEKKALLSIFQGNDECEYYLDIKGSEFKAEKERLTKDIELLEKLDLSSLPTKLRYQAEDEKETIPELKKEIKTLEEMNSLYKKAKQGDHLSAKRLLLMRKEYEYEGIEYVKIREV